MFTKSLSGIRADSGFSMIELLIVLVTIGILVAAAQPSLAGFVQRNQTRRALDRLVADVSSARLQAVHDSRRTSITIKGDGSYTIDTLSTGGVWVPARTVVVGSQFPGVAISPADTRFEFNSRGLLVGGADNAIIVARRGSRADSIFVSAAGRVYRDF